MNGNLSATGVVTGSGYQIGSNLFDYGSRGFGNAFLGFAGNGTATNGGSNTANGVLALYSNATGSSNTANGVQALYSNTTGNNNTADGVYALYSITTGSNNTAVGFQALVDVYPNTGSNNTATGYFAGLTVDDSSLNGSNNSFFGTNAALGTGTLNNATAIGAFAEVAASNALVLGSISGVNGCLYPCGNTLVGIGTIAPAYGLDLSYGDMIVRGQTAFNTNGQVANLYVGDDVHEVQAVNGKGIFLSSVAANGLSLWDNGNVGLAMGTTQPSNIFTIAQGRGPAIADGWDTYSSRRWKTNIETLHGALGTIEHLRGVSYNRRDSGKHEIGVIAEEVGAVVPEVVTFEENGKDARGVDYSRLTALLIEATKDQQKLIEEQRKELRVQHAQIERLTRQVRQVRSALNLGNATKTPAPLRTRASRSE